MRADRDTFLALDIDGTLIGPSGQPTRPVKDALVELGQSYTIGYATGRDYSATEGAMYALGVRAKSVCDSGANIIDGMGRQLRQWRMTNMDGVKETLKRNVHLHQGWRAYARRKIAVMCNDLDDAFLLRAVVIDAHLVDAHIGHDINWFLDITASGVNKASGVRYLAELARCDKIIAVGNTFNDLPMLEAADVAFCVGRELRDYEMLPAACVELASVE